MSEERFSTPRLALNRIYTRRGDDGETALVGGQRVGKDALRIECYGVIDELNACVGMARASAVPEPALDNLARILLRIQHELFNLGSILATLPQDIHPLQPRIRDAEIERLELEMDEMNAGLPALRSFVLPGGVRINAELHLCRTVCRRAERLLVRLARDEEVPSEAVRYLNRLSDALFVYSRYASLRLNAAEVLWDPNAPAGG